MRRRTWAILAVTTVLAAGTSLTLAQRGFRGHGDQPFGHVPRLEMLMERLDLTDAQRGQLEQILDEHREGAPARREAMRDARQALGKQIHADNLDEAAIRQAATAVAELEADRAVARAALFQQVRGVLNEEQRAELRSLQERRKERMQQRRETSRGLGSRGRR